MFGLAPLPRSLTAALRDAASPKAQVRESAMRDLGRLAGEGGAARAVAALSSALSDDASSRVRAAAAVALADAKAEGMTDVLLAALDDSHLEVRQMALLALGEVGPKEDTRVEAAVARARDDDAAALRFQALLAAHHLGLAAGEAWLLDATADRDAAIRHIAFRMLEERVASGGIAAKEGVLTAAVEALGDRAPEVRLAAAILLARQGRNEGHGVIAEVVERGGPPIEPDDEQAAVVLSGELGIERARRGLARRAFRVLGAGRFAYEALTALARLGDARAKQAIVRDLGAWSRDTRTLAVVAAGNARLREARGAIEALRGDARRAEPDAVEEALAALGTE